MATEKEKEWADRARRFIKAELKRGGIGYKRVAPNGSKSFGLEETEASISEQAGTRDIRGHVLPSCARGPRDKPAYFRRSLGFDFTWPFYETAVLRHVP